MANLSFSVAINLITDKFKSGAQSARNGLRDIQIQALSMVAAMGVGSVGLSDFVSNMVNVARESSRVSIALKNVSGDAKTYAENQKFLIDLSKKYGLYINDLTGNFSKFTASADMMGMSTKNQQKIFESLSRATVNYGLSSDEANGVFLALSQMMGKGTIQAQELKLQMGEKLPVAIMAMAKAAGTSVAGMMKMMEQGKLTTAILPKFADELNKLTQNANLDNIETSFNGLKNKFKELTDTLNVGGIYKSLLDQTNQTFGWIMNNLQLVGNVFVNIIGTLVIGKGIKMMASEWYKLERQTERSLRKTARLASVEFDGMGTGMVKFGKIASFAMKSAFSTFAPMVIIAGLIAITEYFVGLVKKQNELKAIWTDYQNSIKNAGGTNEEIVKMQSLQRVMNSKVQSQKNINTAQKELMGMLGLEKANHLEINKEIAKRINLYRETARAQLYTSTVVDSEKKIDDTANRVGLSTEQLQRLVKSYVKNGVDKNGFVANEGAKKFQQDIGAEVRATGNTKMYDVDAIVDAVVKTGALNRVINDANKHIDKSVTNITKDKVNNTDPKGKHKQTDLEKAEEDYTNEVKKLTNQRANDVITELEYQRAMDTLNKETYKKVGGLVGKDSKNTTFLAAKKGSENPFETDIKKIENDFIDGLKDLKIEKEFGLNIDDYNTQLKQLINSTLKQIKKNDKINLASSEFAQSLIKQKEALNKADWSLPEKTKVDHTFDYKKTDVEKTQSKLDVEVKYKDDIIDKLKKSTGEENIQKLIKDANGDYTNLKKQFGDNIISSITALDEAILNTSSLEDVLKMQEIRKDIKDLEKEINNGIFDGVKSIGGSSKNMFEGYKQMADVINDVDADGWEKFLAVWDTLTNTVDQIMSVVKMITALAEATEKLKNAQSSEKSNIKNVLQKQINKDVKKPDVTDTVQGIAGVMSGLKKEDVTGNLNEKTDTAKTEVAANTAVAVSGAVASAATLPFPFNLIEMAGAATTVFSLMSNLQKFALGGVVGGSSYTGDKILAGVNSGELILNQDQQNKLLSNGSGSVNGGGSVVFKIEGSDLKGVLKNYDIKKSKVKK